MRGVLGCFVRKFDDFGDFWVLCCFIEGLWVIFGISGVLYCVVEGILGGSLGILEFWVWWCGFWLLMECAWIFWLWVLC